MSRASIEAGSNSKRRSEIGVALGIVAIIALLVVPLPGIMLDLFLALSIGLALVVLLVALYTTDPLEFSVFPAMLLILTLFRLALNVSSTRLILSTGEAGRVIDAFVPRHCRARRSRSHQKCAGRRRQEQSFLHVRASLFFSEGRGRSRIPASLP